MQCQSWRGASVADMDVYLGHRADPMLGRWILAGSSFTLPRQTQRYCGPSLTLK